MPYFFAFILLLIAIVPLGLAVKSKGKMFGQFGILLTSVAFVLQLVYFVVRWVAVEHAPVSNMYEFMTFFGIMLTGSYLIIHFFIQATCCGLIYNSCVLNHSWLWKRFRKRSVTTCSVFTKSLVNYTCDDRRFFPVLFYRCPLPLD
ncbi:hypothetical protein OL548_20650 [Lysinibacillus sp. MHQ-1]|nr:hypothetical protein OL548_20650 [Lysinibacillus sp. MHQ-1]